MNFLLLVCAFYPLNALCITIKCCEVLVSCIMIWIVLPTFRAWERLSGIAPDSRQGYGCTTLSEILRNCSTTALCLGGGSVIESITIKEVRIVFCLPKPLWWTQRGSNFVPISYCSWGWFRRSSWNHEKREIVIWRHHKKSKELFY